MPRSKRPPLKVERRRKAQQKKAMPPPPKVPPKKQPRYTGHGKLDQYIKDQMKKSDDKGGKIGEWIRNQQEAQKRREQKARLLKLHPPITEYPTKRIKFPPRKGPTSWGQIGPITHPPITMEPKKGEEQRPYKERGGQGGFFEEPVVVETGKLRAPIHRANALRFWAEKKITGFFRRMGTTYAEYQLKQLEVKEKEGELVKIPGRIAYKEPETGKIVTLAQEWEVIGQEELPELLKAEEEGTIVYEPASGYWTNEITHKKLTPSELRAVRDRIRAKIRHHDPPKNLSPKKHRQWFENEIRSRERQMEKILPSSGAPIPFEGTAIQANPQQRLFSDLRLNKTYNIAVRIQITDQNYDSIMGDIDNLYKQTIGRKLNIILHSLSGMYQQMGYMMGAKLNFTQHLSSGGEIGWYPTVRYISVDKRDYFEDEIKDMMFDGLNTIKKSNYQFDMVEFVYIELHFTTDSPAR